MECGPTASVVIVNDARPLLSVAVPRAAVPSLKVTTPVGPPAVAFKSAVNVTDCPYTEGFTEEVTVAKVVPLLTVCVNTEEVLLSKLVSPV